MARRYGVRTETGNDSGQVAWPEKERAPPPHIHASSPRGNFTYTCENKRENTTSGTVFYNGNNMKLRCVRFLCEMEKHGE